LFRDAAPNDRDSAMLSASVTEAVETPAFVVDEGALAAALDRLARVREACGSRVLYALKPLTCPFVLEAMRGRVDGFAASSVFEARLARSVLGDRGVVHITTPGFRPAEIAALDTLCDRVAFNSLGQLERLGPSLTGADKTGLRVNPQVSLVEDPRYDPCRPHSKLGVPLKALRKALRHAPGRLEGVRGILIHTNCDAVGFRPLLRTVRHVVRSLRAWLGGLAWANLGGGYLLEDSADLAPLSEAVARLREAGVAEVCIEPGASTVRRAVSLVSEVIDLFRSGGRTVAVLDTSINHLPEAFEYQFEPDVEGHTDEGRHEYILAGSTCLAGDVFGEYAFEAPLRLGDRVVLPNLGAYALVKMHMFNGVNLPTLYSLTPDGALILRRRFDYDDFLARSGASRDATV
jgi:carboxynorspermidine decarboxylase